MRHALRLFPLLLTAGVCLAQPADQVWQPRLEGRSGIAFPVNPALDVGANYTFSVWVFQERRTTFTRVFEKGIPDSSADPRLAISLTIADDGTLRVTQSTGVAGSGRGVSPAIKMPLNQWTHLAVTSNGSAVILYVNGAEAGRFPSPGPIPVNNVPLGLGSIMTAQGYGCCGFAGFMRQFSIWSRALSAAEIKGLMTSPPSGTESGLAGYWPLDDGPGFVVRDLGPRGLTGIVQHRPTTFQQNGTSTRTPQDVPSWVHPAALASVPFDWTAQPQTGKMPVVGQRLVAIDFDNDGDLDVVGADYWNPNQTNTYLHAYRNDGGGSLTEVTTAVFGATPQVVKTATRGVVADFNRDGRADLFFGDFGADFVGPGITSGAQNRIFIQTADGRLVDESAIRLPASLDLAHDADGADINGDGAVDLVFGGVYAPHKVKLTMNDGTGRFTVDSSRLPTDAQDKRALVTRFVDVNADGRPDLFLGLEERTGTTTDLLLLNDGTGRFRNMASGTLPARLGGAGCGTVNAGFGDLNGDGKPDIVLSLFCSNYFDGGFQILINRGDGTFTDATAQWLPDGFIVPSPVYADSFYWPRTIQFADFTGDGRPDVIVQSLAGRPAFYLNTGSRLVSMPEYLPNFDQNASTNGGGGDVTVADFNRDGRPDIVLIDDTYSNVPGAVDTLWAGLGKRNDAAVPFAAPAPEIPRLSIVNEASLSADHLAPGTRVRIRTNRFGPTVPVTFNETAGAVPPTSLGGVTVTFDSVPARLLSVSSTEITAIVPYAVAGKWIVPMQVRYGSVVSQPVYLPITPSNPQIFGVRAGDGRMLASAWRPVNGVRVPVTGSLTWGERFSFRVTGAGQAMTPIIDGVAVSERVFTTSNPFKVALRDSSTGVNQDINLVSLLYAPEGLTGVVEVTVELPASRPPGINGGEIYVYNDRFNSLYNVWWPQPGVTSASACTFTVAPQSLSFTSAGGSQAVAVTTASGCPWSGAPGQAWTILTGTSSGTGSGVVTLSAATNPTTSPRTGTVTIAGQRIAVTQAAAAAGAPSISAIVPLNSSSTVIQPGAWVSIYGSNLSTATTIWDGVPLASGFFPSRLGDVSSVTFNGKPGYFWFVSPGQINVQAPDDTATGSVVVVLTNAGGTAVSTVTLAPVAPSLSLLDAKHVAGVIPVADKSGAYGGGTYDLVGVAGAFPYKTRPVRAGEFVVLFGTGFGPVAASPVAGRPYDGPAVTTLNSVTFTIGGVAVKPAFAGLAAAGLYQFNLLIPEGISPGEKAVVATVAGSSTPAGFVIDIQ